VGLIDNVLGGSGGTTGGGMSPITMALVGLLAYRTFQGNGRLADMLGRHGDGQQSAGAGAGVSPSATGGASSGAPRGMFSGLLGAQASGMGGGLGGLLGGLGGLLGGGATGGSILSGGLGDLLHGFEQNGQGDKARSWVARGANTPMSPSELEQGLGEEKIAWLMQQTGLPRDQLLQGLSQHLPDVVDKLTPDGRLPTAQEAGSWTDARR
jgi:uncharacterized protein YidB (DUF937 family)